jgi:hypothetical protein
MKVGDIVRQGDGVIKFRGSRKPDKRKESLGVVIGIYEDTFPDDWDLNENVHLQKWSELLGRRVDVMWRSGKITRGFAEKSLEVVQSVE